MMADAKKSAIDKRKFPPGTDPRKDARREAAAARQETYDALSVEEKVARAKTRRGKSSRELARLVSN